MKIVHVFWGLIFGGIETMLVNIANAQYRAGAEVTVVIINDLYEESLMQAFLPEIKVVLLHRKWHSKNPAFIFRFNRLLKRVNPDAIHLHDSRLYCLIFSRRLSREACVTLHALPTGSVRRGGWLLRLFPPLQILRSDGNVTDIDKIPRVFAISRAVQQALKEKYGVDSVVVNNGILTSRFLPRPSRPAAQPLRLVQVSRLEHDKKGQDLLIEAVAKLKGRVEVDFIGRGGSLDYLQELTHRLGATDYVHFLGKQPQDYIAEHLKDYDLFVQPSRYEGFGLTVAEAMAAQVPVLVSAGQGPAEVTCGEQYGWTFENGSADDLCEKIAYVMTHYQEAQDKACLARQYVVDTYDVSVTARHYLEKYGN